MVNLLGHHLNKVVSVSIPALFKDEASHPCRLVGFDLSGLWLESEELGTALFPEIEKSKLPKVFVPFAQINFLVEHLDSPNDLASPVEPNPRVPSGRQAKPVEDPARKKRR
jgi:hypothetical protein